jgi:hypothetical protein
MTSIISGMAAESVAREFAKDNRDLRNALTALLTEVDKFGIRKLVAGWNGEDRPEGDRAERHHPLLGATLRTNCGHVYALDETIEAARIAITAAGASQ